MGEKNRQIGVGVKIGPGGLRAGATVKSGPEPLKEHLGCALCGIVGDNLYQYRHEEGQWGSVWICINSGTKDFLNSF